LILLPSTPTSATLTLTSDLSHYLLQILYTLRHLILTTSLTTFLLLYTLQLTSDAGHSILTILVFKRPMELFTLLSVHAMYLYVA
jgi:hypothetical protein